MPTIDILLMTYHVDSLETLHGAPANPAVPAESEWDATELGDMLRSMFDELTNGLVGSRCDWIHPANDWVDNPPIIVELWPAGTVHDLLAAPKWGEWQAKYGTSPVGRVAIDALRYLHARRSQLPVGDKAIHFLLDYTW